MLTSNRKDGYLAKSLISSTPEHGAETLTHLWREANLAETYLSNLPVQSQELENTANYEKLDAEIKKTNDFLMTLKELHNHLD